MRLIDADSLELDDGWNDYYDGFTSYSETQIKSAQTYTFPVNQGRWVEVDYKTLEHGELEVYHNGGFYCSKCRTGFKKNELRFVEFCPSCGSYNGDKGTDVCFGG